MTTNPIIRPAVKSDINAICKLLHAKMNRKIEPQRWRNLMTYHWLDDKPDLGRVIDHQGEILGFLGMIYSDRNINQRTERIVNICAWYLDKSLRGLGLGKSIMADATSNSAMSYTIMTSSKNTVGILDQVGYQILDDERYIWFKQQNQQSPLIIETDVDKIFPLISAESKSIIADHTNFPVTPVLAQYLGKQCLMIFSIKKKGENITFFDLLYTSDRGFIGKFGQQIANALLPRQAAVLAIDCRFVDGEAINAVVEKLPVPRFFKSLKLHRENFDHLYTELQLLDLKLD